MALKSFSHKWLIIIWLQGGRGVFLGLEVGKYSVTAATPTGTLKIQMYQGDIGPEAPFVGFGFRQGFSVGVFSERSVPMP